jgi:outer membrane protein assembly factor BamB
MKILMKSNLKSLFSEVKRMKVLLLILAFSLCIINPFYAQQFTKDYKNQPKDELGFIKYVNISPEDESIEIPFSNQIRGLKNLTIEPSPDIVWSMLEQGNQIAEEVRTECNFIEFDEQTNTLVTVGEFSKRLAIVEINPENGAIIFKDSVKFNNNDYRYMTTLDMELDDEGNIVVTGYARNRNLGNFADIMVVKYDRTTKDTVWTKALAGDISLAVDDLSQGLVIDNSGYIYINSKIQRFLDGSPHQFCGVYKLDPENGEVIWLKEIGEIYGEGLRICIDSNDDLYVECLVESGAGFFTMIKLDSDGNELWRYYAGNSLSDLEILIYRSLISSTERLFLGGLTYPEGTTTQGDFVVAELDTQTGEIVWLSEGINGLLDLNDNAQYIDYDESSDMLFGAGIIRNEAEGQINELDILIAGYDASTGTTVWQHQLDGDPNDSYGQDLAYDLIVDPAGYVIVTGKLWNAVNNDPLPESSWEDMFTIKLDAQTGEVFWLSLLDDQLMPSPLLIAPQYGYALELDPENGNVWVGGRMSLKNDMDIALDYYTVLELSESPVGISENSQKLNQLISVFPNPGQNEINISNLANENDIVELRISDINGKTILENRIDLTSNHIINTRDLSKGVYFIHVSNQKSTTVTKWVKN